MSLPATSTELLTSYAAPTARPRAPVPPVSDEAVPPASPAPSLSPRGSASDCGAREPATQAKQAARARAPPPTRPPGPSPCAAPLRPRGRRCAIRPLLALPLPSGVSPPLPLPPQLMLCATGSGCQRLRGLGASSPERPRRHSTHVILPAREVVVAGVGVETRGGRGGGGVRERR